MINTIAQINESLKANGRDIGTAFGGDYETAIRFEVLSFYKGNKVHAGFTTIATGINIPEGDRQPNAIKVGGTVSYSPMCNGNGQRVGQRHPNLDTDTITCKKCIKQTEAIESHWMMRA